jgi:hypothetical protein
VPVSDCLAGDDPRWHTELHRLFVELREQTGAVPVRWMPPADAEKPLMLVVLFHDTAGTRARLSTCLGGWLTREPGWRLDLAVNASTWSERTVLCSGDTWLPAAPGEGQGDIKTAP